MPAPLRVVLHVAAVVAGAAAGVLGSFVHPLTWLRLPVGLLEAFALTAAVVATAGLLTRSRSGAGAAVAGWLVAVVTMSLQRSEGDLVVPASVLGYCWLLGGTVVAGATLAWPYALLPRPCSAADPAP